MNENPLPDQQPVPPAPQPGTLRVAVPHVRPLVTYSILGFTILVYLLQIAGQYFLRTDYVTALGIKVNPLIRAGEIWRLISPLFLHASILHIGFNMYALFIYGRDLEARYGHWRFALLYFLSGYAGNVLSFLLTPAPSLGASTAVFGLLAAEGMFIFQNRKLLGGQANRVLMNVLSIAAVNLLIGFSVTGVDNYGHLGGILGGLIFSWFGGPRWRLEGFSPAVKLVDEREGHGALAGTLAVLIFFIPLSALGWFWIIGG
jgi:rhomboid protease GluP